MKEPAEAKTRATAMSLGILPATSSAMTAIRLGDLPPKAGLGETATMALMLARDSESQGDLISWWDGDQLEADTQVSCAMDEVVMFIDDDEVVATLGPGRHSLVPPPPSLERYLKGSFLSGPDKVAVAFVTTRTVRLEAEGILEELDDQGAEDVEPTISFRVALRITDATKVVPLLEKLSEDECLEDWLIDELVLHAQAAATESNRTLAELASGAHGAQLAVKIAQNAGEILVEYGIELQSVDEFAVSAEADNSRPD
jgi:hypothetical protein